MTTPTHICGFERRFSFILLCYQIILITISFSKFRVQILPSLIHIVDHSKAQQEAYGHVDCHCVQEGCFVVKNYIYENIDEHLDDRFET
jgi:hypothetical protein